MKQIVEFSSKKRIESLLRAEAVAQELRHQLSSISHWEPSALVSLLQQWQDVTPPSIKWHRPDRLANLKKGRMGQRPRSS